MEPQELIRKWTVATLKAYGWPGGIAEEDALARLLALNAMEGATREGA